MKNERFERYIYMGVTAILVLIAAVFVVFLFLERNAVFAFLGKVRFVLAPVIYGAVLAFLMSPVYNWCYNTVVYVHDDDKEKEDEEKKIAPKKRFIKYRAPSVRSSPESARSTASTVSAVTLHLLMEPLDTGENWCFW